MILFSEMFFTIEFLPNIKINIMSNEFKETLSEIFIDLLKWIGIVICIACVSSLFISTQWVNDQMNDISHRYNNDDSDVANLLEKIEYLLIDAAIWIKNVPILIRSIGIVLGGFCFFIGPDDDN